MDFARDSPGSSRHCLDKSQTPDSALASATEVKAIRIEIGAAADDCGFAASDRGAKSISSKESVIDLDKDQIEDYVPLNSNYAMGVARYKGESVLVEW